MWVKANFGIGMSGQIFFLLEKYCRRALKYTAKICEANAMSALKFLSFCLINHMQGWIWKAAWVRGVNYLMEKIRNFHGTSIFSRASWRGEYCSITPIQLVNIFTQNFKKNLTNDSQAWWNAFGDLDSWWTGEEIMLICQGLIWGVFESRRVSMRLKQNNHTMLYLNTLKRIMPFHSRKSGRENSLKF